MKPVVGTIYEAKCPTNDDCCYIRIQEKGSFDFVICIANPPAALKNAVSNGSIAYAIFEESAIPFFLVEVGKQQFSASMNIHSIYPNIRYHWLATESKCINIVLVESVSNLTEAVRQLAVDNIAMLDFKDLCIEQYSQYLNASIVKKRTIEIGSRVSINEMALKSKWYH